MEQIENRTVDAILALHSKVRSLSKMVIRYWMALNFLLVVLGRVCAQPSMNPAFSSLTKKKKLKLIQGLFKTIFTYWISEIKSFDWCGWLPGLGNWAGWLFETILKYVLIILAAVVIIYVLFQPSLCLIRVLCLSCLSAEHIMLQYDADHAIMQLMNIFLYDATDNTD